MIRIIDERGSGKTSRLMLLAKENDATIVCSNPRAMEYKAKAYGIDGLHFISYGEFIVEPRLSRQGNYIIDELEQLINEMINTSGSKLIAYSITKD